MSKILEVHLTPEQSSEVQEFRLHQQGERLETICLFGYVERRPRPDHAVERLILFAVHREKAVSTLQHLDLAPKPKKKLRKRKNTKPKLKV